MAVVNGKRAEYLGMDWLNPYIDSVSQKESEEKSKDLIPEVSFRRHVKGFSSMLQRVGDEGQLTTEVFQRRAVEEISSSFVGRSSLAKDHQRSLLDRVDGVSVQIGSMQLEPLPMPVNTERKSWFEEISDLANQPNPEENMSLITTACVLKIGANVADAASEVFNFKDNVMDWARNTACNVHPITQKVCDGVAEGNDKILKPILDGATDLMNAVSGLTILEGVRGDIKPSNSELDIGVYAGLEEYMFQDLQRIRDVFVEHKAPDDVVEAGDRILKRAHERGLIDNK